MAWGVACGLAAVVRRTRMEPSNGSRRVLAVHIEFLVMLLAVAGVAAGAPAWTVPLEISAPSGSERSTPRIARGPSGNLNVVYIKKGSPWSVHYRQRSAAGNWGPVEQISSVFSTRPDVAEDTEGRPHVLYAGRGTNQALDLVHAHKNGGAWSINFVTATDAYEDQPHVVTDSAGRIHMVFTRTAVESSSGDVVYRMWDGASWSGETVIGHTSNAYYHRPDVSIDAADHLHAIWVDKVGTVYKVRYRKYDGSAWTATIDVGSGEQGASFFNHAKIGAVTTNDLLVVWHDDAAGGGSNIVHNHSHDGGATWAFGLSGNAQGQVLYAGHYPGLDAGGGAAHLVSNLEPTEKVLVYSRWNGSTWNAWQQTIVSNDHWKGWPDIAADGNGETHAAWDEPYGSDTWQHRIDYSTSLPDVVPPGPVTAFVATAAHDAVHLNWANPGDLDFARTVIRASTAGYPGSSADGELVADMPNTPGSSDGFIHTGVVNGTRYYYAAFARDTAGNDATANLAAAVPFVPPDIDRDGDVDMADWGDLQRCLSGEHQAQNDPGCGPTLLDGDNDVDAADVALFLGCLSGPDTGYVPTCME